MQKNGFKLIIFVGDVDVSVAIKAKSYYDDAYLITSDNLKILLNLSFTSNNVIYTSLGDLSNLDVFENLLLQADEIIYEPPVVWSDGKSINTLDPEDCIKGKTEGILIKLSDSILIKNIEYAYLIPTVVPLVATRLTHNSQLWIAGCSISHGIGVSESERFGALVAVELDQEVSFLTRVGSSINWAADQIIRSDLQENDTVIWGITCNERIMYIHEDTLMPGVSPTAYKLHKNLEKIVPISTLLTQNTFYTNIYAIERVINFCRKLNVNLLMIGIIPSAISVRYLKSKKEYHHYPYKLSNTKEWAMGNNSYIYFEVLGSDNWHPGTVQHQSYKNFILKHLKYSST